MTARPPRRLRPSPERRGEVSVDTHTALSARGEVRSAAPVSPPDRARLYNPPIWKETYSVPGALTPLPGKTRTYNREGNPMSIASITASVDTAPVGDDIVLDVLKNGSTIYTTTANRPTIRAGRNDTVAALPDDVTFVDGDFLTIAILQVGSTTAGADLTVQVRAL